MLSAEGLSAGEIFIRQEYANIIQETRKIITNMNQEQRFRKAKSHIMDALAGRQPRPLSYSEELSQWYLIWYCVQSSWLWSGWLFLLSFVFMYLVILEHQSYVQKISIEAIILVFFIADNLIDHYCECFSRLTIKNKYPKLAYIKTLIIILMVVDLIIFAALPARDSQPIRPFRILRAVLPLIYNKQIRRSLIALFSAYKELLAFIIYYSIIIVGFALIGSQTLTFDPNFVDPDPLWRGVPYSADMYYNNYTDFGRMIYSTYGLATWDFYPDFQLLAVQNFQPNYIFFIVFIFFNMFLFAAIPGAVVYSKFRQTRSRYIIFDQIKQQHSLILAFVTLAQQELNLSMDVLVQFLFYFYLKKIRYIEYITEICKALDDNNNGTIQVNQFMQLSKVILYNSIMFPPRFEDLQTWIELRQAINQRLGLEAIVTHWLFDVVVSIYTLLGSVNAIILLFNGYKITSIFDTFFIWLYFVELIVRIVAVGPQTYFAYRWNNIDSFLIMLNVIFFFVSTGNDNIDNLFIIIRFFRVAFLFKTLLSSPEVKQLDSQLIQSFTRLFQTFVQIFPIITRFFLLFAFFFYIFGIIGMQLFYKTEQRRDPNSPYDQFSQFSNFQTFINSQYAILQVLTQGAWAKLVYDYCWHNQEHYGWIVFFFMLMHFVLVFILSTLLKGIFWEIYFTVSSMIDEMEDNLREQVEKQEEINEKTKEINQINQQINQNQSLQPDTVIRRELIQMKMDMDILKKIKNIDDELQVEQDHSQPLASDRSLRNIQRSKLVSKMMQNLNISVKQFKKSRDRKRTVSNRLKRKKVMDFKDLKNKQDEDFHSEMQDLLNKLIISSKIKYSYISAYPTIFVNFLNSRFKQVQEFVTNQFDLYSNPLQNEESLKFHMYQLAEVVNLQYSQRAKKGLIVECLVNNKLIDEKLAQRIIKTKSRINKFHIDSNGALKKMYLADTNEDLIKKLQIQYFSDVYGHTFKQINKVSLEPLLKVQASLTYTLWNVLSYPQIQYTQFFHFLTFIEDQISNKLLKPGSLFKFVYKISSESDIWFSVDRKRHQEVQIRFIKSGLWAYTPQMEENQPYYARDIFKWQLDQATSQNMRSENNSMYEEKIHEQYMKLFFQSFQTLAFGLIDKHHFFQTNPKQYIYDLYLQNFDVAFRRNSLEVQQNQLKVSNIMLVILSKQEQRRDVGEQNLSYPLSDIKNQEKKRIKQDFFLLDDQEKETFEKLKNLAAVDQQKIIESQGLPFSYIVNLMKQMSEMLQLYSGNFQKHIEKALNQKYNNLDNPSVISESSIGGGGGEREREVEDPKDIVRILPDFDLDQD